MPLSDSDAEKLCRGRLVYAPFPNPSGAYRAGPHWAVMLDPTDKIQRTGTSKVVVVSTNDTLDPTYLVPAPRRAGLTGNVVCSWVTTVAEPAIIKISQQLPLTNDELLPILEMIATAIQDGVI